MARPSSNKRERLTQAAVDLAHAQGLHRATIADIAAEASVAPGSVYYYFKTKDDVARAVISAHRAQWEALTHEWDSQADPRARLMAYIDASVAHTPSITAHGSAVAGLCADLRQSSPELAPDAAAIYTDMIEWIAVQFAALGFKTEAARARALHLVTGMEGAASMAHALNEPEALEREAAHLRRWVERSA